MNKKKNLLLIIDNDTQTQKMLDIMLDQKAFTIDHCKLGKEGIRLSISLKPDVVLLDLDLPDMHGQDVIKALREWSQVPIIVLTAQTENKGIVTALNLGADDYVTKPFSSSVLEARINAALRKNAVHEAGEPELCNGILRMDLVQHHVYVDEKRVPFTPKEYNLLRYMMIHRGKMLSQRQILISVWGPAHAEDAQYLRVFIGQIRAKIEKNPSHPVLITTEAGVGYRMEIVQSLN